MGIVSRNCTMSSWLIPWVVIGNQNFIIKLVHPKVVQMVKSGMPSHPETFRENSPWEGMWLLTKLVAMSQDTQEFSCRIFTRFRMLLNGSVLLNYDNGSWIGLSQESYCVDEIHTAVQEQGRVRKSFKRGTKVLLVCKDEYKLKGPKVWKLWRCSLNVVMRFFFSILATHSLPVCHDVVFCGDHTFLYSHCLLASLGST